MLRYLGSIAVRVAVVIVFMLPWLARLVSQRSWPLSAKRVALTLMALAYAGSLGWILLLPGKKGESWVLLLSDILLGGFLLFGLFLFYRFWPHEQTATSPKRDVRELVECAVADAENELKLSVLERLDRQGSEEGVYAHHLTRYADGSWLERLFPAEVATGVPDFSFCAVYSNNRDLVNSLVRRIGGYCNVEQTKRPLWKDK